MNSPDLRSWLQTLADAEAVVPARVVLERLPPDASAPPAPADGDLTVEQVAERLRRSPSTVRGWLGEGEFPHAFKLNRRSWLIPASDVAAFLDRQRPTLPQDERTATGEGKGKAGDGDDLGSWRQHFRGGA